MFDFSLHELKIIKAEFEKFNVDNPNQNELQRAEKFFRRILKNNNAIKLLVDRENFEIIDSNEMAQDFYGYSEAELAQTKIFELNALSKDDVIKEYERSLNENRDYFESRQKNSNGDIEDVIVRSTPLKLSGKNYFYLLVHKLEQGTEILEPEEPRNNETKVFKLPDFLERQELDEDLSVIEKNARDLVILSNKLAESEEMLKNLNASKDRFFSIISHDLKNSFFSIMSLSKKLSDPENRETEEQRTHIAQLLYQNSTKLYSFLENLLTWARVQRGEIIFDPKYFNLYEIVSEIVSILILKAQEKDIHFKNNIDKNIIVYADQNMVNTILRNLLSNSLQFTKVGGNVEICSTIKENDVIVTIKDNGIGISKENQQKLLKIDQKYIGISTEGEKGTGLGLILCKEFVDKHDKDIWIESELGKGSKFHFTLSLNE